MSRVWKLFKRRPRVDVDAMMETARGLIDSGRRNEACTVLREVVAAVPNFGPAWRWLGATLVHTGDLVGAREALEQAKRFSPRNPEVDRSLAMLQQMEEQAAIAQRLGGSLMIGDKTAQVGEAVDRRIREMEKAERDPKAPICRICKRPCQILPKKLGHSEVGVQCERCSTFYCSGCLDKMLQSTAVVSCLGCRASKVKRPANGGQPQCDGFRIVYYQPAS